MKHKYLPFVVLGVGGSTVGPLPPHVAPRAQVPRQLMQDGRGALRQLGAPHLLLHIVQHRLLQLAEVRAVCAPQLQSRASGAKAVGAWRTDPGHGEGGGVREGRLGGGGYRKGNGG